MSEQDLTVQNLYKQNKQLETKIKQQSEQLADKDGEIADLKMRKMVLIAEGDKKIQQQAEQIEIYKANQNNAEMAIDQRNRTIKKIKKRLDEYDSIDLSNFDFNDPDQMRMVYRLLNKNIEKLQAENQRLKEQRILDLYVEFGDGKVLVLTTEDNELILSKQHGTGVVGDKGKFKDGDKYTPSEDDIVMKFKNIESLLIVKDALIDIEQALAAQPQEGE